MWEIKQVGFKKNIGITDAQHFLLLIGIVLFWQLNGTWYENNQNNGELINQIQGSCDKWKPKNKTHPPTRYV